MMSVRINLTLEASEMFLSIHMIFSLERAAVVLAILERINFDILLIYSSRNYTVMAPKTVSHLHGKNYLPLNPTRLVLSPCTYIGIRYRLMKKVQFWTVRFHETSLLILSLLIILDYFITDWFYNIVFKR